MEGEGFEPPKAEGRQVYSLVRLAASLPLLIPRKAKGFAGTPALLWGLSQWPDSNGQPSAYKADALPLELHWPTHPF